MVSYREIIFFNCTVVGIVWAFALGLHALVIALDKDRNYSKVTCAEQAVVLSQLRHDLAEKCVKEAQLEAEILALQIKSATQAEAQ